VLGSSETALGAALESSAEATLGEMIGKALPIRSADSLSLLPSLPKASGPLLESGRSEASSMGSASIPEVGGLTFG
jgi:hypothetical protein